MAHSISDMLFNHIKAKSSIFNSHIIFVSDRNGSKKSPVKELYIMDF